MFFIILLGIIQGIAEFLPISSSAHLIIFRDLFGLGKELITSDIALTYDVALHFGTVLSILYIFYKDFINIFIDGITKGIKDTNGKIFWLLIISCLPAGIFGIILEDFIDNYIRNKYFLIALSLIIMGILLYLIDKKSKNNKRINNINIKDALVIGLSQVLALIPGFSRSGTTILAARLVGLDRETSAKYSFYLSFPIILGAVLLTLLKTNYSLLYKNFGVFILGTTSSFLTGIICIKYLLKYLNHHDFKIFMLYRVVLGIIIIIYLL